MAISNYSELKTAVSDWMARTDVSGSAADFIMLAEARLNRLIGMVTVDAALTGEVGGTNLSTTSLSIARPLALFALVDGSERPVLQRPDGSFEYNDISGVPSFWSAQNSTIQFERPLDGAYAFRFTYQGKFALSDAAPTNRLLVDSPDVYLAAAMVWGAMYVKDAIGATWKAALDEFILETRNMYAQSKRGVLTVDPALSRLTNRCGSAYAIGYGGYSGLQPDDGYSFLEIDSSLVEIAE